MNNYSKKILIYKTPLEVFLEEFDEKNGINKIYKLQKINTLIKNSSFPKRALR